MIGRIIRLWSTRCEYRGSEGECPTRKADTCGNYIILLSFVALVVTIMSF